MENDYPDFSVLISVYSKEKPAFLQEALESIIMQTVMPKEIVIVEDGTLTEQLDSVIGDYHNCGPKLNVVRLNHNVGLGAALKAGTAHVSTEFIARMDSDDICVPNRFELQLTEFKNNPTLSMVGGQIDEFKSDLGNIVGSRRVPTEMSEIVKFFRYRNPFNHPTIMLKKKDLLSAGGYISFPGFEDYHLWGRLIKQQSEVKNIDKVIVHMRTDDGLYSRRGGIRYLRQYFKLRKFLCNMGLISFSDKLFSNIIMAVNVSVPTKIREKIYKALLHKKKP